MTATRDGGIDVTFDETFEDAFFWALNYNGWEDHADAMCEYLRDPSNRDEYGQVAFPRDGKSRCVTGYDVAHDNPNSILWMCLVMMFGEYGTSPRYGWITRPDDAAGWMRERYRATYHGALWPSGEWVDTDESIRDNVREWERA